MALTKEKKEETLKKFGRNEKDTGSPETQIALMTQRINDLTEHLKTHPKDYSSLRGLYVLVGKRRRLLNYYKASVDPNTYAELLTRLNLRK